MNFNKRIIIGISTTSTVLSSMAIYFNLSNYDNLKYMEYCNRYNNSNPKISIIPITLAEHRNFREDGYKFSDLDKIKNITSNTIDIGCKATKISAKTLENEYIECCAVNTIDCFTKLRSKPEYKKIFNPSYDL